MIWTLILGSLVTGSPSAAQRGPVPEIWLYADSPSEDPDAFRPAALASDHATWFTAADYPARARRAGRMGEIVAVISIAADDHLTDCKLLEGAEQTEFAAVACPLLSRRGKFRHALAWDGTPMAARLRVSISFYLRRPTPSAAAPAAVYVPRSPWAVEAKPFDPGALVISGASPALFPDPNPRAYVWVSATGVPTKCWIAETTGTDQGDVELCRRAKQLRFSPALNDAGRPVESLAEPAWTIER